MVDDGDFPEDYEVLEVCCFNCRFSDHSLHEMTRVCRSYCSLFKTSVADHGLCGKFESRISIQTLNESVNKSIERVMEAIRRLQEVCREDNR